MKFVLGLIIGIIIVPLVVYAYFVSGSVPVATAEKAMPFETKLAKKALHARLEKEAPNHPPVSAGPETYAAGAQIYVENCAVCHGLPGQDQTAIASGMFPKPPKLLEGKGVTDDPPGETYWVVANGIRLSGMPAFNKKLSDVQLWQVALLLANAHDLPPDVRQTLANAHQLKVAQQ
jgi:mono/diheme cytochrome c family protein